MNRGMIILNILEFFKVLACAWMAWQLRRIANALEAKSKKIQSQ